MDIAPATRPATPAIRTAGLEADAAATPIIRLAVETMASSEPSTAARNHLPRPLRRIFVERPVWRRCSSSQTRTYAPRRALPYRPFHEKRASLHLKPALQKEW